MNRSARKILIAIAAIAMASAAIWHFLLGPMQEHRKWSKRAIADIRVLAEKRPPNVNPGQWEFMVGWTINLHANCGSSHTWVDRKQMWPFLAELEQRLEDPVSAATIDWIWDEYARITKFGQEYDSRYRPTRSPDLELAQPGCFSLGVK